MKKYQPLFIVAILIVGIVLFANVTTENATSQTQQLRFGFVNTSTIMTQFDEARRAQREFESIITGWENELRSMIEELQEKYEDYQQKQAMMTEAARLEAQQSIVELEQRINQYNREKFQQPGGEMFIEQERLFSPIREKILSAIESVAKEERLDVILDRTEDVPVVLYAEPRLDVTFKVLDYLRRGSR